MDLPHSTFYEYAKRNAFFVIGNKIHPINSAYVKNGKQTIEVQSMPVDLEVLEKVYFSDLEKIGKSKREIQSIKNESKHIKLAEFVIENVLGRESITKRIDQESIIGKIIPKDGILINYGLCYEIYSDANGTVKVNGTRYGASKKPYLVEDIESRYLTKISETIFSPCLENITADNYYDKKKGIGFLIDENDFYVYTEIGPYALYERSNGICYMLGKARVGSRLALDSEGRISWNRLVVIDSYSHPSLPEQGKPFQVICVGGFNYDTIESMYPNDLSAQIVELMRKGRKVLTSEYTGHGRPWHRLTENMFSGNMVKGECKIAALNY